MIIENLHKSVIAIIPARYDSTRFIGKPLYIIKGKTMIEHVYSRVKKAKLVEEVLVATDDKRIFEVVQKFGGKVVMTSKYHKSGTDRIAEAVKNLSYDFILNVQGDEPLIPYRALDKLIELAKKNSDKEMFTIATQLKDIEDVLNPNVVKVVMDKDNNALYFSRHSIPHRGKKYFRHIGVYLYTKECLKKLVSLKRGELEKSENLEQLRALENGIPIKILKVNNMPPDVDVPEDINKILELMRRKRWE